jgi:hypothetical protein
MKIYPANTSDYNAVKTSCIVDYIVDYVRENKTLIDENNDRLRACDRTQLKAIAAELETVNKRLEWLINGRY